MFMSSTYHNTPHYTKNVEADRHFKLLREEVNRVLKTLPISRLSSLRFNAFLLPALYVAIYITALFQTSYFLFCIAYIFLGFMLVIIFLNLIHEASHNTLFRGKKINQRFMLLFDLIGANSYMWNKRHVTLHHNYTNVEGWDSDIEKSEFLKVHPLDVKKPARHYQHLLIFLYPLFITNWFLLRDFKDFFNPKMIVRKLGDPPTVEYLKLFFFKGFFVFYLVVIPALLTPFYWWQAALALFIMLLSAGFFALTVLLPPHVNTSNQFPVVSTEMKLEQSWLMHQLNTTNDVTTSNLVTRYVMANCNFHIAHHLFPNISHVYAKEITAVIINYSRKAGLPYRSYPLFTTLKNHYRLIKSNGRWLDILEEDM